MQDKSILEITKYIAKYNNYLEDKEIFLNFYKGLKEKIQYGYAVNFKITREK